MTILADYHTHTIFSHGKDDVVDNAIFAKEKGLKAIGISDHGFNHPAFGLSVNKIAPLKERVVKAKSITGIDVLLGVESNIIGTDGTVDLKPKNYDDFDLFIAGVHKFVMYKFGSIFSLALPNLFHTYLSKKHVSKSAIKNTTKAYINVIKNNPVDIISHVNFCCFSNALEVAKCASDYGTYIELNSKKSHLTNDEINDILAKTSAKFIINSDAHSKERVGDFSLALKIADKLQIPIDRIANADKLPDFRFKRFKSEAGRWTLAILLKTKFYQKILEK